MNYTVLEFWNNCDNEEIMYQTGFRQRLFIDADIVKPKYEIKEEGYNDGEGNFIRTFYKEQKIFKMEWVVYEYMLDCIYTIPTHDNKKLYLKNGESEEIQDIGIEHEFLTAGTAKVEFTFTTRYLIKTNCCQNIGTIKCYTANHFPVKDVIFDINPIYTAPLANGVKVNDRYAVIPLNIFYAVTSRIYIYTALGWVEEITKVGDVVYITAQAANYFYDGKMFNKFPSINTYNSPLAGKIYIKGFVIPNTYVKIYYKLLAAPTYSLYATIYSAQQFKNGITLSGFVAGNSYNLYIKSYNHNCDYGNSNIVTIST